MSAWLPHPLAGALQIGSEFELTQAEVADANPQVDDIELIQPGQVLYLPCSGEQTPHPPNPTSPRAPCCCCATLPGLSHLRCIADSWLSQSMCPPTLTMQRPRLGCLSLQNFGLHSRWLLATSPG